MFLRNLLESTALKENKSSKDMVSLRLNGLKKCCSFEATSDLSFGTI
jgi:hypothetical protein